MPTTQTVNRVTAAAAVFDQHEPGNDGSQIAASLSHGLTTIRNLMFKRVHDDVEQAVGSDSMIMPVRQSRTEKKAKIEIELYQVAVSTIHVQNNGYVNGGDWYLDWLAEFRLGEDYKHAHVESRLARYSKETPSERRLHFTNALVKSLREAGSAPLVLYRLYPLAVGIVTSVAMDDRLEANSLRNRQTTLLPAIGDCHECHGRVLDNGEICPVCSNPVWSYKWLTATD